MEISAGMTPRSYRQAFENRHPPRDANSVMAAGSFTVRPRGFPVIPAGPEFRVSARGPQDRN